MKHSMESSHVHLIKLFSSDNSLHNHSILPKPGNDICSLGYGKWSCYKHLCISFSVDMFLFLRDKYTGLWLQDHGKSMFKFLRICQTVYQSDFSILHSW